MSEALYDVAIIGGGPAGSTSATLLARAGRRVIVCEREKFPRFHIGESLLPVSMKTFTRLGVHEKFERAGFLRKFGGEMTSACCEEGVKFYFKDGYRSANRIVLSGPARRIRQSAARPRGRKRRGSARANSGQTAWSFSPIGSNCRCESKFAAAEKISSALCDRRERAPFCSRQLISSSRKPIRTSRRSRFLPITKG